MAFYQDINEHTPTIKPMVKDAKAVAQWLSSLLMTGKGEVLFKPDYGFDAYSFIFELMTEGGASALFSEIQRIVEEYDPEVLIDGGASSVVGIPENNAYIVDLAFTIKGFSENVFNVPLIFKA